MSAPAATSQISATRPLNTSSIPQIPGGEILTSCASMSLPGTYAGQVEPQQLAVQTFPSSTIDDFVYRGFVLAFMLLLALVIPFRAFGQGAAAPVFSPVSGGYHTVLTVTLSDSTSGAPIYYTTDGTVPTTQSTLYTGPITVGSSENLEAVALAPGGTLGPVVKAWYTIVLPAAVPVPSLAPGAYGAAQTIVLSDATPNATIYYTVTGTYPNTSSPIYTGPFIISKNTAVQALATATGYESSPVLSAAYTIAATAPTITPASGTYTTIQTATLSTATPCAYILYTTDGSTPTSSSKFYNGPFSISANETVNAVAFAANYTQSAVASMTYTVILPAAAPTFSPAAGSFVSAPNVTIKSVTAGATIYYTIDGSAPTTGSAVYSGPVAISANETLSAMALAPGGSASAVTQGAYVIDPPATAPVFSPVSAVYNTVQTVAITAAPGATIYYTIDGSQPTSQSTRYTGTIVVGTSTKVQAVALAPGQ